MLQHLKQPETDFQDDKIILQITELTISTSKKLPPQENGRSDVSSSTPFIFHIVTDGEKAFINDAMSFTEIHIFFNNLSIFRETLV